MNARNKEHCNRNKNAFDVLISRLDMAKETISKIENMLMEIPQTETQREMG